MPNPQARMTHGGVRSDGLLPKFVDLQVGELLDDCVTERARRVGGGGIALEEVDVRVVRFDGLRELGWESVCGHGVHLQKQKK